MVDLGFGASPVTTLQLHRRLAAIRSDVNVVGIEIDPGRVERAREWQATGVSFAIGGFELSPLAGRSPLVIRAANVLRQYPEAEVAPTWELLRSRLQPEGVIIDATCNELGRIATWVAITASGPVSLTISVHLGSLEHLSAVSARLPKALIHRNLPGEPIHDYLAALQTAWLRAAGIGSLGARQRFVAAVTGARSAGWPIVYEPRRWRLGEVSVPWSAIAPRR